MNQELFDQIILNNLIAKLGTSAFGYIAANNGVYDTYYTNNEFQNFITEMKIIILGAYFAGIFLYGLIIYKIR